MSTATASIDEQNKLSIIKQHFDDMAKLIAEVNKIYSSAVQSISKDNESLKKLQDVMHQLENFQKQKDAMFQYLDNVRETLSHQDLYQIISKQQTSINIIISKIQALQYDDNLEEVTSKIETYSNQIAELGKANESDVKNFDTLVEENIRNIQKQFRDFREACIRITAKKLAVQQKTQEQTNELEQRIQMMQDVLLNQKNSSQSARTVNSNLTRMINKIAEEASYFNKKRNTVNSRSLLTLIQRLKKYHDSTKRKPHTIANFSQEISALTDITSSLLEEEYHSLMADMKNGTEVTAEQIQHFNDIFTKTLDKQGKFLTGKSFDIFVKYMPKLKGEHERILTSFETLYSYPKLVTNAYIDTLVNELKQYHENPPEEQYNDYQLKHAKKELTASKNFDYTKYSLNILANPKSLYASDDVKNAYKDFGRDSSIYNEQIQTILKNEEIGAQRTGRNVDDLFKEDFVNGRFTQPLLNNNDRLLSFAQKINKNDLKKNDVGISSDVAKQLTEAIHQTYRQIQILSRFDPDSKLLEALKQQAKDLEEQRDDLVKAGKDDKLKGYESLFKSFKGVKGFFEKALVMMGLGGLFSFNKWKDMIKTRANENGKMMYNNFLANTAMGAFNPYTNSYDLVYNYGQNVFKASYGQIGFDAYSNMYQNLSKNLMGRADRSGSAKAQDAMYFTYGMTLPVNMYGISAGTATNFASEFYMNNRMSAKETMDMFYDVIGRAQKSNIPIEKYMRTITTLSHKYREIGYGGKQVAANIQFMIDNGLRIEDAQSLHGEILGAQTNFSLNKSNAVYSILAGQTHNMFTAMFMNLKTHDRFGNPIQGRQKLIGEQMMEKLRMTDGMFSNPVMRRFNYMQQFMGMGVGLKNANLMTDAAVKGDTKKLGAYLDGAEEKKLKKNMNLKKSVQGFANELANASALLSEKQKNQANMMSAANQIAEHLGSHREGMQAFSNMIDTATQNLINGFERLVQFINNLDLKNIPGASKAFAFAIEHPFLTLGGAYAGWKGLKYGAKKLTQPLRHWNDVKDNAAANQAKQAKAPKSSNSSAWKTLKNGIIRFKPRSMARFIVAGTNAAIGLATATTEASPSEQYEKIQEQKPKSKEDEKKAPNQLVSMFKSGKSNATILTKDGKRVLVGNEQYADVKSWLTRTQVQVATTIAGIAAVTAISILAYKTFFKDIGLNLPKIPKSPKKPHKLKIKKMDFSDLNIINQKIMKNDAIAKSILRHQRKLEKQKNAKKFKEKQRRLRQLRKKQLKSGKLRSLWEIFGNGLKELPKTDLLLMIGLPILEEFMSSDEEDEEYGQDDRTALQKVSAGVIEGTPYFLLSQALSKIPRVGGFLSIAVPLALDVAEQNGYKTPISDLTYYVKQSLGVQRKINASNLDYLNNMVKENTLTGEDFDKLIKSDTEQGKYFREYLSKNGIEYSSLNETEKAIFKEEMDALLNLRLATVQVLAMAVQAFKQAMAARANAHNLGGGGDSNKQLTAKGKEYIKNQLEAFFPGDDNEITNLDMAIHTYVYAQDFINEHESEFDYDKKSAAYATLRYLKHRIVELNGGEPYELTDEDNVGLLGEKSYIVRDPYDNPTGRSGSSEELANKISNPTGYTGYISAKEAKEGIGNTAEEDEEIAKSAGFYGAAMGNYEDSLTKQLINDNNSEYVENKPVQQNSASQSSSPSQVDGDYGAYASMVEQAKMISQLTGLPADVIFAQLAFETGQNPSDMAYSDKIHNYGGTIVDMGHGKNDSGFGIYVNNQEGAEAYVKGTVPVREQLPQLREAIAQGDLKKYVHLLKYGMEESGKGNYQYFTGDENEYLNGIMSYLSLAHKFGLNGVIPNGTYDFSAVIQRLQNLKPKTLKEQWDENISNYKTSVGNGKIIKGAYTHNGLYLDASLSAPSIVEENQKLREKYANGLYNDDITPSTENIMTPEKLAEFEKKKMYLSFKAVQEETKMMVEAERKKSQQKDVIFRRTLEEAKAKTEKELNKEEKDDRDTIVLNVLAKLKDGLSSKQINQIYQEVNKILTDNGFEADSYITQT